MKKIFSYLFYAIGSIIGFVLFVVFLMFFAKFFIYAFGVIMIPVFLWLYFNLGQLFGSAITGIIFPKIGSRMLHKDIFHFPDSLKNKFSWISNLVFISYLFLSNYIISGFDISAQASSGERALGIAIWILSFVIPFIGFFRAAKTL